MVEMHLAALRVALETNTPVVLLQEVEGARRTLPILIGQTEAMAIEMARKGIEPPRPFTHDLMKDLVTALGVTVEAIVITELKGHTYYAEVRMIRDGKSVVVSARPSDAMALALRTGSPIYADESLLDAEGVELAEQSDPEELLSQFHNFIDQVRPEDFAS